MLVHDAWLSESVIKPNYSSWKCPANFDWLSIVNTASIFQSITEALVQECFNNGFIALMVFIFCLGIGLLSPIYKRTTATSALIWWQRDWLHYTHDKQTSSQRKCREHLSNQPPHRDNVTHQGISISQPCYEDEWMEWLIKFTHIVMIHSSDWYHELGLAWLGCENICWNRFSPHCLKIKNVWHIQVL